MAGSYADKNGKEKSVRTNRRVGAGYDAPFRGYINLNLSEGQKETYPAWAASASLWDTLEASVSDGVNVALKIDPKGEGFLASATQRREGSVNAGLVVTARGKDPGVAFGRLLFCLALLSHQESWEATQPMADPDRW
jgi:hypothetical protein